MQGGQPDRVPMPLRMWKFLRKHYPDTPDPLEKDLLAHDEFGIDIWHYTAQPPLPCFEPIESWRDDVTVEMTHEVRDGCGWWERTVHTPEGDLHDVKRSLIITEGAGSGPEVVEPLVKDLARDIPLLRYMHADPDRVDIEAAQTIDARIGDRGLAIPSMMSPIDCRSDVMKQEDFLMLYYDNREAFREIVRIGAEAMMAETLRVLEAGFKVVKTWWFYASPSAGWSPTIYEDVFLPHLVKHVELVHSYDALYVYYDDGKMDRFLDLYVDSGIDCLMTLTPPPMGDAIPADVKRRYGDRICLMGGIDAVNEVYLSTPEKIREMVKERLAVYMPGGKYIMDGSNSLVWETPAENVRALADAGQEFGEY